MFVERNLLNYTFDDKNICLCSTDGKEFIFNTTFSLNKDLEFDFYKMYFSFNVIDKEVNFINISDGTDEKKILNFQEHFEKDIFLKSINENLNLQFLSKFVDLFSLFDFDDFFILDNYFLFHEVGNGYYFIKSDKKGDFGLTTSLFLRKEKNNVISDFFSLKMFEFIFSSETQTYILQINTKISVDSEEVLKKSSKYRLKFLFKQ